MRFYCVCLHEACVREPGSNMWVYVFLGNALRGIGETPVTPLGISYIDDFAKAENSPFYIGEIPLLLVGLLITCLQCWRRQKNNNNTMKCTCFVLCSLPSDHHSPGPDVWLPTGLLLCQIVC